MPNKKPLAARRVTTQRAGLKAGKKSVASKRVRQTIRANRSLTKKLLMHPLSTFGMLVVGVLLANLTLQVLAFDYSVSAVVAAPPLTEGAVITSPKSNQTLTAKPITVSGTCPNTSYVKLFRNGAFSGVAICNNGTFQMTTDLFTGANDLQAQAFNITDQAGPQTAIVHVTYQLPATPKTQKSVAASSSTTTPVASTGSQLPVLIQGDYHFNVATTNSAYSIVLKYQYSAPPVDTKVNWGDGSTSHLVVPTNDSFKIQHTYKDQGYYPITVTGTDAEDRTVEMQLVALVKKPGAPATKGSILPVQSGSGGNGLSKFKWLLYAWPAYVTVAVMIFSFWLGERRELLVLTKASRLPHRRVRHS